MRSLRLCVQQKKLSHKCYLYKSTLIIYNIQGFYKIQNMTIINYLIARFKIFHIVLVHGIKFIEEILNGLAS